jgi:hypothetical protein
MFVLASLEERIAPSRLAAGPGLAALGCLTTNGQDRVVEINITPFKTEQHWCPNV